MCGAGRGAGKEAVRAPAGRGARTCARGVHGFTRARMPPRMRVAAAGSRHVRRHKPWHASVRTQLALACEQRERVACFRQVRKPRQVEDDGEGSRAIAEQGHASVVQPWRNLRERARIRVQPAEGWWQPRGSQLTQSRSRRTCTRSVGWWTHQVTNAIPAAAAVAPTASGGWNEPSNSGMREKDMAVDGAAGGEPESRGGRVVATTAGAWPGRG